VPTPLPKIDFDRIREHESSQQRAWEELSFLLVGDIDQLPQGTRLERRAAPDGGIEFSCAASGGHGGTWAWQAKYLNTFDNSVIQQMQKSFLAAVASTPTLTRYAFVVPVDRSATGAKGKISALVRWERAVTRWQAKAATLGRKIDIVYIGHSEVLAALQLDHHAGAFRYFFDEFLFTNDFFTHQVQREVDNLGERYDPEVHVDIGVVDYLDAVGLAPAFARRIITSLEQLERAALPTENDHTDASTAMLVAMGAALDAQRSVRVAAGRCIPQLMEPNDTPFSQLDAALKVFTDALWAIEALINTELAALPPKVGRRTRNRPSARTGRLSSAVTHEDPAAGERAALYEVEKRVSSARRAATAAHDLLTSAEAHAAHSSALLLTGPAGCGKSHLVADAALDRVRSDQPTLLLLGQHLQPGPVWRQLCQLLDLDMSAKDMLATLSVAARVRRHGRAVLIIDAINEGAGADVWPTQLAGFLADCADFPWIGVAMTVRDTYRHDVLPPELAKQRITEVLHTGLAGHEEEALQRYATHYHLRLPDFPPLLPELTNPLFLRSLCRSVHARGHTAIPRQATSLSWVFDGLLEAANRTVSSRHRLDRDLSDDVVGRAVTALAAALLDADDESLPFAAARDLCQEIHPEPKASRSLLQALIAEGVLLRERVRTNPAADPVDQIRFTYQRMADHVRAETLLNRYPADQDLASAVLVLAAAPGQWRRRGLIEALVLLTGERRGTELAVLLGLEPLGKRLSQERQSLRGALAHAFFATLRWRDPTTLGEDALALLQRYLKADTIRASEWLTLLLSLACVPDHPLNVRRLDRTLRKMNLAERDLHWSREVLSIESDDNNPVSRTIDWAWSCSHPVAPDVVDTTATLLAWLFTSPNRRLRDTATKALLHLTEPHTDAVTTLITRFAVVDDPYIVERVMAVACGHTVRRVHHPMNDAVLDQLATLGRATFDATFATDSVPPHLLLRYYAQTTVEVIDQILRQHGRVLDRDVTRAQPPYPSPWPLVASSKRMLARGYGQNPSSYLTAVSELGSDFERYIITPLVEDFALPDQARRLAAKRTHRTRVLNRAVETLLAATAPQRRTATARRVEAALSDEGSWQQGRDAWAELSAHVPQRLRADVEALRTLSTRAKGSGRDLVHPSRDLVGRWIASRVLELGWTPERFASIDRGLSSARSHGWSETERFGKKYAWIAYFDVAGQLADHCTVGRGWGDEPTIPYRGPWQLSYVEDLDPTVVLRGDEPPQDSPAGRLRAQRHAADRRDAWWMVALRRQLRDTGTDHDWLQCTTDIPAPETLMNVTDPSGQDWAVLELHSSWCLEDHTKTSYRRDRRELHVRGRSFLMPTADAAPILAWAVNQRWDGTPMTEPIEPYVPFLKGYPDLGPWPANLSQIWQERDAPDGWASLKIATATATATKVASATASCVNTPDNDYSSKDHRHSLLLAPPLLKVLQATWASAGDEAVVVLGLGAYETEHCWSAGGKLVAFSSKGPDYDSPAALYVRRDAIEAALSSTKFMLLTTVYAEKVFWANGDPSSDRGELHAVLHDVGGGLQVDVVTHVAQLWSVSGRIEHQLQ